MRRWKGSRFLPHSGNARRRAAKPSGNFDVAHADDTDRSVTLDYRKAAEARAGHPAAHMVGRISATTRHGPQHGDQSARRRPAAARPVGSQRILVYNIPEAGLWYARIAWHAAPFATATAPPGRWFAPCGRPSTPPQSGRVATFCAGILHDPAFCMHGPPVRSRPSPCAPAGAPSRSRSAARTARSGRAS